ncbi:MFS transporter [Agromyces sp. CFH 90414]|uniref:MFS transporter n=1 Tax=Agromyces agglutinans TaxID=2662258 RepID=A0A6I2F3H1_9MICO|nr:MFS transporter [Agromyces agglutinans]MRG59112.1 MFS transporter [Agromyces agglutinans]
MTAADAPETGRTTAPASRAVLPLAIAQFIMVLDSSVMSVSISQLVEEFDTTVSTIQLAITLYALVMAALMLTGGKIGDLFGRLRMFRVGLVIYAVGSLMTAFAPTVEVLIVGWSFIEGAGAALVLPALAALVAGSYEGPARARAYGLLGGVAGAGIAVGPLIGGWLTTAYSWRWVFAGEVVLVIVVLAVSGWIARDTPGPRFRLDLVGALLSALGLALIVVGVLQSGTWGWLQPVQSPITPFGFALTPFVIAAGLFVLWGFFAWERRVVARGRVPLLDIRNLRIPELRAGLASLLAQNLILLGIFFAVPIYLQVTQGMDAFQTGLRLLPTSIAMLLAATIGARVGSRFGARAIVRVGLLTIAVAGIVIVATIEPELATLPFGIGMALVGLGTGLLASQLGNVVQSSVPAAARSEAGGLQYTAQNLGSSLGTALIGSFMVGALATSVLGLIAEDPGIEAAVADQAHVRVADGIEYLPPAQVERALLDAGFATDQATQVVESYSAAQLVGVKAGMLACTAAALVALPFTRRLPGRHGSTPAA